MCSQYASFYVLVSLPYQDNLPEWHHVAGLLNSTILGICVFPLIARMTSLRDKGPACWITCAIHSASGQDVQLCSHICCTVFERHTHSWDPISREVSLLHHNLSTSAQSVPYSDDLKRQMQAECWQEVFAKYGLVILRGRYTPYGKLDVRKLDPTGLSP